MPAAQLLPGDALAGLPGAIGDLADILGRVSAALQLRDTRPAALAVAALQAATDAQAAQDAEVGSTCCVVDHLRALLCAGMLVLGALRCLSRHLVLVASFRTACHTSAGVQAPAMHPKHCCAHPPAPAQAAAFEAGRQLEAQVAAATAALRQLRALADELEAEGQARAADAEADRRKAAANGGRAERYVAQQAQLEAGLAAAGYTPEVRAHSRLWSCVLKSVARRVGGRTVRSPRR